MLLSFKKQIYHFHLANLDTDKLIKVKLEIKIYIQSLRTVIYRTGLPMHFISNPAIHRLRIHQNLPINMT